MVLSQHCECVSCTNLQFFGSAYISLLSLSSFIVFTRYPECCLANDFKVPGSSSVLISYSSWLLLRFCCLLVVVVFFFILPFLFLQLLLTLVKQRLCTFPPITGHFCYVLIPQDSFSLQWEMSLHFILQRSPDTGSCHTPFHEGK